MAMTTAEMIDEVMICAGPIRVHKLIDAIREIFCARLTADVVRDALEADRSFVKVDFDKYSLDRVKRAERLAEAFGFCRP